MMHDHIIRALLAAGTGAIGRFVRFWLFLLACEAALVATLVTHDHGLSAGIGAGLVIAALSAVPAAVVAAILIAAVKF